MLLLEGIIDIDMFLTQAQLIITVKHMSVDKKQSTSCTSSKACL